jgi:hypothetical protein
LFHAFLRSAMKQQKQQQKQASDKPFATEL